MESRERVKACELWRVQGGEHSFLSLAHHIGMRGSLELEVSIFRENERRYGHRGGNLGPHCSDSDEGWKCHLIQETQVTSGIGPWQCCDGSGHASILDNCHGGIQGQKLKESPSTVILSPCSY